MKSGQKLYLIQKVDHGDKCEGDYGFVKTSSRSLSQGVALLSSHQKNAKSAFFTDCLCRLRRMETKINGDRKEIF